MLIGNLGREPELQTLEGNIKVARFPLATTELFREKSGKMVSQTEWHNVVAWRSLAELAVRSLRKGSLVFIDGRLQTKHKEDKNGRKYSITDILADNIIMLDKRKEYNQQVKEIVDDSSLLNDLNILPTSLSDNEHQPPTENNDAAELI
jgi:single-strand DNA-binding protein